MKKRKIIIIIIIIAILLIIIGSVIHLITNNGKTASLSNEEAKDYINNITDTIMDGGTKEKLLDVLQGISLIDANIMTGEDMYLLQEPEDYVKDEYPLNDYITLSKTLANNLEQKVKDNFDYEITSITKDGNNTLVYITFKTYYYTAYINDLQKIQDELLVRVGYDINNIETSIKYYADLYKAKIKAAAILDSYLDNYNNSDEYIDTIFTFVNNNIEDSAYSLMEYHANLVGFNYDNKGFLQTDEDVNNILANYDLTNPLAL